MTTPVRAAVLRAPAYPFTPIDAPIKLDQNESPYDFPSELKAEVLRLVDAQGWNRYPDLNADTVRLHIAQYENWDPAGIVVTPGSNVLIQHLTALAGMGQQVLSVKPGFALYALDAQLLDASLQEIPLADHFALPSAELHTALRAGSGGVFYLNQPHAPTGSLAPREEVLSLLETAAERWLTVIDEAYVHYSPYSYRDSITAGSNRLLLRTFSKAWGLAGLRMGYALTTPALAQELQKLVAPFNVSAWASACIAVALANPQYMERAVSEAQSERQRMYDALSTHPSWTVYPSHANFLLIRTPNAQAAYQGLLARGILVRRQDSYFQLEGCIRVSVGTPEQNTAFLAAAMELA